MSQRLKIDNAYAVTQAVWGGCQLASHAQTWRDLFHFSSFLLYKSVDALMSLLGLGVGPLSQLSIPNGRMVFNSCIQSNLTWRQISHEKGASDGAYMKSRTLIESSFLPWWSPELKCFLMSLPMSHLWINAKCPFKWSINVPPVWPTYCLPHWVQVMQYITFILLQVTFLLHSFYFLVE